MVARHYLPDFSPVFTEEHLIAAHQHDPQALADLSRYRNDLILQWAQTSADAYNLPLAPDFDPRYIRDQCRTLRNEHPTTNTQ